MLKYFQDALMENIIDRFDDWQRLAAGRSLEIVVEKMTSHFDCYQKVHVLIIIYSIKKA